MICGVPRDATRAYLAQVCECVQTFFTHRKVMFSEAWVSNSVHRGRSAPRGRGCLPRGLEWWSSPRRWGLVPELS